MISWLQRFRNVPYPEPPLRDYWVQVEVRLEPQLVLEDGTSAVGYFRFFGLRSTPGAVSSLILERVSDGAIVSFKSNEVDVRTMDRRITKELHGSAAGGLWHESGRIYFMAWQSVDPP